MLTQVSSFLFFFWYTYLLRNWAIKYALVYESSPSLHIEAARLVECPSGPSLGEFLVVFRTFWYSFHCEIRLVRMRREETVSS